MRSAGLLPYRTDSGLEVLVAHPGGPYFARKDSGWWSLVKGEVRPGEDDQMAAAREFEEETGLTAPKMPWISLGSTVLRSKKVVIAWAVDHPLDVSGFNPGTFTLHGKRYPEIDRIEWLEPGAAREKLNAAQTVFIDRLEVHLRLNTGWKE